jgi:hypothetical protein
MRRGISPREENLAAQQALWPYGRFSVMTPKKHRQCQGSPWSVIISVFSCIIAVLSAMAAWQSASNSKNIAVLAKSAQQVQLRPYVLIDPVQNVIPYDGSTFVILPYQLTNKGSAPALNIHKGYASYVRKEAGQERLIQFFEESTDKRDALAPSQSSAIHVDEINISGVDVSSMENVTFKVELKVTYQGFSEVDTRSYYSKAILILTPQKQQDKIVFLVSQPYLDFGFEK